MVGRLERGHVETLSIHAVRGIMSALDVRLDLTPRWRGGELDRVIDSRHASIATLASNALVAAGWTTLQEVTYAIYRERGSIDVLGVRQDMSAAAVMEVKSELMSWEETQRRFDEKIRLLPKIVFERFGWRPRIVGRILVLDATMTNRRRIAGLGAAADQAYPARTRLVSDWICNPDRNLGGIWYVSNRRPQVGSERRGGFHRVRTPKCA